VFLCIAHGRRELVHLALTAHPTAAWVWWQVGEATPRGRRPTHRIRDRDRVDGGGFRQREAALGIEAVAGGRRIAARMIPGNGEHHCYWQMAARSDGTAPGGRATFILKAPGIRPGYRQPAPVELVDVAPTLAFVSGIPVPRQAEGRIRHELFEEELF
jgi:hypothetical protein